MFSLCLLTKERLIFTSFCKQNQGHRYRKAQREKQNRKITWERAELQKRRVEMEGKAWRGRQEPGKSGGGNGSWLRVESGKGRKIWGKEGKCRHL